MATFEVIILYDFFTEYFVFPNSLTSFIFYTDEPIPESVKRENDKEKQK